MSQGFARQPPADFLVEVAKGTIPGHSIVALSGHNPALGTALETVWDASGIRVDPAAAAVVTVSSSSALDTAAGVGARLLLISGLDASYNPLSEVVSLLGVVPVATIGLFLRVFRADVATAGTDGDNAGIITGKIAGNNQFAIQAGFNRSQVAAYTIPAGKTGFLSRLSASVFNQTAASVRVLLVSRPFGGLYYVANIFGMHSLGPSVERRYEAPARLPGKTDVRVDALAGIVNTEVNITASILLVDD